MACWLCVSSQLRSGTNMACSTARRLHFVLTQNRGAVKNPVSSDARRQTRLDLLMPTFYDPNTKPDPADWLVLDEQVRITQAATYHKKRGIRLPNKNAHATFHAIIENQIASNDAPVVRAMDRLKAQGLDRHDCIHAIAWVLSQHLFEQMKAEVPDGPEVVNSRYYAGVERLNAKDWLGLQSE